MSDPKIRAVSLDVMVDTSLKNADRVLSDKEIKGELYRMRHAQWEYWPFEFEVVYHVVHGMAIPLVFHYRELIPTAQWQMIVDTSTYRSVLVQADEARAKRD